MPAGIFISYRRQEALAEARGIYERLRAEFGSDSVFIDLEGLDYGVDFVESLERQLQHCQVLLALIGPQWLATPDGHGGRRLDDENDFVRIELRTALQRGIRVVPVLLDGALMPRTADLPADLQPLLRRQALELDFRRFDADIARLVGSLRRILTPVASVAPAAPVAVPAPPTQATPIPPPAVKPAPVPEPTPEPAPLPPVQTLLGTPPAGEAQAGEGSGGGAGRMKPKTLAIAAGTGAAVLGAVWFGIRPPALAPAAEPVVAAASAAAAPVPVAQPASLPASLPAPTVTKSPPPMAASATLSPLVGKAPPALTAAQAEVLRQTKPDGQEIYKSLELKPKAPPPLPKPLAVGQRFRDCDDDSCPWMVVLPAGSFLMGSPDSEPGRDKDEGPQHRVQVASVAIGQYEVTFQQWDACVAAGGCQQEPNDKGWGRDQRPVIHVSLSDAQQYVKWLSVKTGQIYRLPSEAEWEYAARAGTSTPFAFGEQIDVSRANFNGNETYNGSAKGEYRERTLPVGSLAKNEWGLYDLHGNVAEWVLDCPHPNYQGAPIDGRPWTGGCSSTGLLIRGGGWNDSPIGVRSANRQAMPLVRDQAIGFRLARRLQ